MGRGRGATGESHIETDNRMPADLRCGVHGIVCIALCCGHVRHLPGGKLLRGGVLTAGGKQPYCPAGSSALIVCAAGFYCSDNMKQVTCGARVPG